MWESKNDKWWSQLKRKESESDDLTFVRSWHKGVHIWEKESVKWLSQLRGKWKWWSHLRAQLTWRFINEEVKVTMWNEKVKVMILPFCAVDIEVFTYEKVKVISDYLNLRESESDDLTFVRSWHRGVHRWGGKGSRECQGWAAGRQRGTELFLLICTNTNTKKARRNWGIFLLLSIWTNTVVNLYNGKYEYDIRKMGMMRMMLVIMVLLMMMITLWPTNCPILLN